MIRWLAWSAGTVAAAILWAVTAMAQQPPQNARCDPARAPQQVSGHVVKVDMQQLRVTIRATDGVTHEFQASKETLADMKPGDRIEAKLRSC